MIYHQIKFNVMICINQKIVLSQSFSFTLTRHLTLVLTSLLRSRTFLTPLATDFCNKKRFGPYQHHISKEKCQGQCADISSFCILLMSCFIQITKRCMIRCFFFYRFFAKKSQKTRQVLCPKKQKVLTIREGRNFPLQLLTGLEYDS